MEINPVVVQDIAIGETVIALYPVFTDSQQALKNVSVSCKELLMKLQADNRLDSLSDSTWQDYQKALAQYDAGSIPRSYDKDQFAVLDMFLDLYENQLKNQQIIQAAKRSFSVNALFHNEKIDLPIATMQQYEEK